MDDTLLTMIANATGHDLVMKVGNRSCFVPLALVKPGCQHAMELCINWTYQEFMLEQKNSNTEKRIFVNSDDCCDYERITIKELDGEFVVERELRKQVKTKVLTAHKWTFAWMFWLWR